MCKAFTTLSRERSLNQKKALYGKNYPWLIHCHISKDWSNLKELHIENVNPGKVFLEQASKSAKNLKKLTIAGYKFASIVLRAIYFNKLFPNLQELHLDNVQLSFDQVCTLMKSRYTFLWTITVGIWIPTIWIPETFEYQTFWSSDLKWFGIQMVGLWVMSYVLDRPFEYWTSTWENKTAVVRSLLQNIIVGVNQ